MGRINLTGWKAGAGKPPKPGGFEWSTKHGARVIGRRTYYGYQLLRKTECSDCGANCRQVWGYFGAVALHELLKEDYGLQKTLVEFKLQRFAKRNRAPRCGRCAGQDVRDDPFSARTANERRTA